MSQPVITQDASSIDILSQPPVMGVSGANLRAGMVLVDLELLCPCAILGYKIGRARDSVVTYMVHDLDTRENYRHRFHVNHVFQVVAR